MSQHSLPVIDFAGVIANDAAAIEVAARQVHDACAGIGFFIIRNHGVPRSVIVDAVAASAAFFAQPLDIKMRSKAIDHRGYVPIGNAIMEGASKPDYKESFIVGLDLAADHPCIMAGEALRSANQWPATPTSFRPAFTAYFDAVARCGAALLRVVAVSLGQQPEFFSDRYGTPLQRTNIIHYPPQAAETSPDQFGGGAHTDYGVITLLWQDQNGGLQVQDRRTDEWIEASPIDDTFVINIGDLLERWSNGRFVSNLHRVINRSGRERYSIATFYDPDYSAMVDPADLGMPGNQPISAGDYILGRVKRSFAYQGTQNDA